MYHVEFAPNAEADVARLSAPMAQQVLKRNDKIFCAK